jgi:GNAT superfamily N-acetyltransferase
MDSELEIRMADTEDINTIGYLAQQIWPVTYGEILSADQMEYMLKLIYSPAALKDQMDIHHQFLIAELNETPVGFASYSAIEKDVYKLHKLYVLPELHGKGLGKAILDFVSEEAVSKGARTLRLNMNRHNKARKFYEKYGFSITKEEDVDIGNNYFMNDYVMEKRLKT